MSVESILQDIDKEIANLTQARAVLSGLANHSNGSQAIASSTAKTGRFSLAARQKMAAAQKARWAKYRASKRNK